MARKTVVSKCVDCGTVNAVNMPVEKGMKSGRHLECKKCKCNGWCYVDATGHTKKVFANTTWMSKKSPRTLTTAFNFLE